MERHKSRKPKETIQKIKGFLKKINLDVFEHEMQNTEEFYSVLLQVSGSTLFVNGKGTTAEYAKASAYGELMERILTGILFRYQLITPETMIYQDQNFHFNDTYNLKDSVALVGKQISKQDAQDIQQYFFSATEKRLVMEEYQELQQDQAIELPIALVDAMYSSNGMAYGNDFYEASVQAMSEIFERYINRKILIDEDVPPILTNWQDYVDSELTDKIEKLLEKHQLTLEVRDCSMGSQYPVVGIVVRNEANHYFVKFGAHFTFTVALERCFTELFQGRNMEMDFWKAPVYDYSDEFIQRNLERTMKDGDGFYPASFFEQVEDVDKLNFFFGASNEEAYNTFLEQLKTFSSPIYFKDYTIADHTVVRYIVPEISNVNVDIMKVKSWYQDSFYQTRTLTSFLGLTQKERTAFFDYLEERQIDDGQLLHRLMKRPVSFNPSFDYLTITYLKGIHHSLDGELELGAEYLKNYPLIAANYRLFKENHEKIKTKEQLIRVIEKMLCYPKVYQGELYVGKSRLTYSQAIKETQQDVLFGLDIVDKAG
ncbi:YcaO-like family protein [Enterococcus ureasiticus]|uniref:YcaO domain-containing protein n=1 Tax=Enterococcus ureasiticus TaxID=903984 RepID=A0A1E5G8K6_9ENTE|nr:YcaO-like family protein [Enterococcus ureasiticus]OEG09009.1 hypothetical protein BCR21_15655 [Enterococcus ureasiticus]